MTNSKQLTYYIYISDTKVDMLAEQVPKPFLKRIALELGIDLKVLTVSISPTTPKESRLAKLHLVTEYINEHQPVGSITGTRWLVPRFDANAVGPLRFPLDRLGLLRWVDK